jgi:hypothetical protein
MFVEICAASVQWNVLKGKVINERGAPPILLLLKSSAAYTLATSLFLTLTLVTPFRIIVKDVNGAKDARPARKLRRKSISRNQQTNLVSY